MKRAPAWITLPLTAGAAFGIAWLMRPYDEAQGRSVTALVPAETVSATGKPSAALPARAAPPAFHAGELHDIRLREALAMPDLAAAIRHILEHEREDYCVDARLRALVELLPASRLAELQTALHAHAGNDRVVRSMLGAWAERDAASALSWVKEHPSLSSNALYAFTGGFARTAPEDALAWVKALPVSTATAAVRTAVVEAMAEKNPAAALDFIKSSGWLASCPAVFAILMQNWGHSDPAAALDGLRKVMQELGIRPIPPQPTADGKRMRRDPSGESYVTLLRAMLDGAYRHDPALTASLLSRLTADELTVAAEAFSAEVLTRDPAAAAAMFDAATDVRMIPVLRDLAGRFPSVGVSALSRVSGTALRADFLLAATNSHYDNVIVAPESRAAAEEALAGIGDAVQQQRTAGILIGSNAGSATDWAVSLWQQRPAEEREKFASSLVYGIAESNPARALEQYARFSTAEQEHALKSLCHALGATHPEDMLPLVLAAKNPDIQAESAGMLYARWAAKQPGPALASLEQNASQLNLAALVAGLPEANTYIVGDIHRSSGPAPEVLTNKLKSLTGGAAAPPRP